MGQEKREPENIELLVAEMGTDIEAFGELYRFYQPRIYRFVMNRVGNRSDAEDIAAVTFEKALRNVDRYDPSRGRFFTWLYQIANNTVTDHLRKTSKVKVGLENVEEGFSPDAGYDFQGVEAYVAITQLMRQIPRSYQEVLVLKYFEGFSLDEIARILGCTKNNASTRLYRGLNAVGNLMKKDEQLICSMEGGPVVENE